MMEVKPIKIGHIHVPNNIFMAPLVGYTCYPFRIMCQELGAGLCFTEMASCNALKYQDKATEKLLLTTPKENIKAAQILGGNPKIMEKMCCSKYFDDFDIIDINMGCPVPNVIKSGEGSALLGDLKRVREIIKGCRKSGKIITVKCRVGLKEDLLVAAEFAKVCEDAGAQMITIHGRTRNMMYEGVPFFEQIAEAKSVVSIPVIANGGIFSVEDGVKMMQLTGADGIMIARHGIENPFIFSELTKKVIEKDKYTLLMEQIDLVVEHYDETFALEYIKKIAAYFMKKKKGTKQYKSQLYQSGNTQELKEIITLIFKEER